MTEEQEQIWSAERRCFDGVASETGLALLAPATLRRFRSKHLRRAFYKEYMLRALGDLRGKHVLDIGCGRGGDSVLLAKLGATVTGIDVSLASIEFVTRRAEAEGLAGTTTFLCSPIETAPLPRSTFDIIWFDNILHHLTHELDRVMGLVETWAKPGAQVVVTEPVILGALAERLRRFLPDHASVATGEDAWTQNERHLGQPDLARIGAALCGVTTRRFGFLGRADRFILRGRSYEQSSGPRRLLTWLLVHADYALLSIPGVRNIACRVVMHGRVAKGTARQPES